MKSGWLIPLIGCVAISASSSLMARPSPRSAEATGITRPSAERKLAFATQGLVRDALVNEGDKVKADQPLLVQEDYIDKKEYERLQLLATSKARVEAAEADLGVKQAVLKRKSEANKDGNSAFN